MTNSAPALKASASSDISFKRSHKAMLNFKGVKKVQANNVPREELEHLYSNTSDNHPKPIHLHRNDQDHQHPWSRLFN